MDLKPGRKPLKSDGLKKYTATQFACFRIIFGSYLLIHFIGLLSHAADIWSNIGLMADSSLNLTHGKFPNMLEIFDSPLFIQFFIILMAICSFCIIIGFFRRSAALILWYGWACLFHRNNLIANPGLPMVGWLLLAIAIIPIGEPFCFRKKQNMPPWQMPPPLFWGAWAIVAVAYTISGIDKFMAPSWRDGSALLHLLDNPLARNWFVRDLMKALPSECIRLMTWSALILEISFGPLCLFRKTRMLAWFSIISMHLGILMVINFADLTLGVIMIHLFTFDPDWFKPKPNPEQKKVILFDGVCGMCNHWVDFILSINPTGCLLFSPLQGRFAEKKLGHKVSQELNTIVFLQGDKVYTKSTAVLQILRQVGGPWALLCASWIIPRPIRDFLYDWIAKNRYIIFGKKENCRLPSADERQRFID